MRQLLIIFTVFILSSCSTSPQSNLLSRVLLSHHNEMKQEFDLHLLDQRTQCEPKLGKLCFDYYHYEEVDVRQARLLIHKISQSLLTRINSCMYLRPFLAHYPLTPSDLDISISVIDPKTKKRYSHDHLTQTALLGGIVHYTKYRSETKEVEKLLLEPLVY